MPGRDDIDQQPAGQRAHDEGRRAPQPQRPVIEAVARHAAQRIGVGQRHHRRPHAGGDGKGQEHRSGRCWVPIDGKPERGQQRPSTIMRAAQRLAPFGEAGHERQDREPRHRRNRRDDPDPRRVDPDRLQPHREERQMGADQAEQRAVKQRQPRRESLGPPRADAMGICDSAGINSIAIRSRS